MSSYEVGKTYEIAHSRKGKMTVLVEGVGKDRDDTWVHSVILKGAAKGIRGGFLAYAGDNLTFRASLTKIIREVPAENKEQAPQH
jgi:hypothetical protein